MAINTKMKAALRALSYIDIDVKKNYKTQRAFTNMLSKLQKTPEIYETWDHTVQSQGHEIPVRIFTPPKGGTTKTLIFFHGGGWVTGDIDTYTSVCATMAKHTEHTVISVDYRLSPEFPFPAAVEDCYAVVQDVFRGHLAGVKPSDVTLIGDSAGGNLAAAVSLMARDKGEFLPGQQILIYPATYHNYGENSPFLSVKENGTDYLLTSKRVSDYMELYKSSYDDYKNPYFAPLMAKDFSNQPRTLIITAEYCPLRDEGEFYGERLKLYNNEVIVYRMKDSLHGYFSLPYKYSHVKKTYILINDFLNSVM